MRCGYAAQMLHASGGQRRRAARAEWSEPEVKLGSVPRAVGAEGGLPHVETLLVAIGQSTGRRSGRGWSHSELEERTMPDEAMMRPLIVRAFKPLSSGEFRRAPWLPSGLNATGQADP